MITNRKINLLLTSLGLLGVLAVATNSLLVLHLVSCNRNHDSYCKHDQQQPLKPPHDHKHCSICQVFLGISGKYLTAIPTPCQLIDVRISYEKIFIHQFTTQHTPTCAIPRAPPV